MCINQRVTEYNELLLNFVVRYNIVSHEYISFKIENKGSK